MAQAEYDRLAHGLPHDEYLAQCGAYQACRRSVDLVDTLIQRLDDYHARTRDTDEHAREHARSVTYATPSWRG